MTITIKQRTKQFGKIVGCERCGRMNGLTRRYGLHMCRQCFREAARQMGFKKFS